MRAPLLFADRTRFLRRPEATIRLGECKVLARSHPPPISSPLKYKNIPDKKGKEEKIASRERSRAMGWIKSADMMISVASSNCFASHLLFPFTH